MRARLLLLACIITGLLAHAGENAAEKSKPLPWSFEYNAWGMTVIRVAPAKYGRDYDLFYRWSAFRRSDDNKPIATEQSERAYDIHEHTIRLTPSEIAILQAWLEKAATILATSSKQSEPQKHQDAQQTGARYHYSFGMNRNGSETKVSWSDRLPAPSRLPDALHELEILCDKILAVRLPTTSVIPQVPANPVKR